MGLASSTTRPYFRDDLSGAKLLELVTQHNQMVADLHALAEVCDAELDGGPYEDEITTQQIPLSYVNPTTTPEWTYNEMAHAPGDLTERVFRRLVQQANAKNADGRFFISELITEVLTPLDVLLLGQPDEPAGQLQALGEEPDPMAWWIIPDMNQPAGYGVSGRLLQKLTDLHNAYVQQLHDLCAIMDGTRNVLFVPEPDLGNTGLGWLNFYNITGDPAEGVIRFTADDTITKTVLDGTVGADLENDHAGSLIDVEGGWGATPETVTVTYLGHNEWSVVGTDSGTLPNATSDVPYTAYYEADPGPPAVLEEAFSFLIQSGHQPFEVGDEFEFELADAGMGWLVEWNGGAGFGEIGRTISGQWFIYEGHEGHDIPGFTAVIVEAEGDPFVAGDIFTAETGAIAPLAGAPYEDLIEALVIPQLDQPVLVHDYAHPA